VTNPSIFIYFTIMSSLPVAGRPSGFYWSIIYHSTIISPFQGYVFLFKSFYHNVIPSGFFSFLNNLAIIISFLPARGRQVGFLINRISPLLPGEG